MPLRGSPVMKMGFSIASCKMPGDFSSSSSSRSRFARKRAISHFTAKATEDAQVRLLIIGFEKNLKRLQKRAVAEFAARALLRIGNQYFGPHRARAESYRVGRGIGRLHQARQDCRHQISAKQRTSSAAPGAVSAPKRAGPTFFA